MPAEFTTAGARSSRIDIEHEHLLTLAEACRLPYLAREGKAVSLATIHRWVMRGVRGVRLGGTE